jgi:cell division septation protein DedD
MESAAPQQQLRTRSLQNPAGLAPQSQQLRSAGSAHAPARHPGRPARMTPDTDGRDGPYGRRYFRGAGAPAWLQMVTGAHGGHGLPPSLPPRAFLTARALCVARGPHAPSASDHARRRCHAADVVAAAGQRARAPPPPPPPLHSRHARPTKFGTPRGSPWVERVHGGGGAALSLSCPGKAPRRRRRGEQRTGIQCRSFFKARRAFLMHIHHQTDIQWSE